MRALSFIAALLASVSLVAQEPSSLGDALHRPLDEILDVNVRDGFVYYAALKGTRGKLDRYVASLGAVSAKELTGWPRERQVAFWLNAYNAFVLRAVVDNYPIRGKSSQYPASSIRQIPSVFDKRAFRAGGREVTLDGLERDVLAGYGDPRLFLAIGRGAIGGGRLRSEAFSADILETQLAEVASESVTRDEIASIDKATGVLSVTPIFSWREAQFVASLADKADPVYQSRSPVERAIIAFLEPHVLPSEREFLRQNTFRVAFHDFDWRLNDLTGGRRD